MFLSSRAGCLGFGHDPTWDEVGQHEALGIELVFVYGEVEQVIAPVGNHLPWTLGPELGQVPFEGAQGLLPQIRLLLYGHGSPFSCVRGRSDQDPETPILPGGLSQRIEFTLAQSFRLCSSLIAGCESCGGEIASANRHSRGSLGDRIEGEVL
jgi:hypothetical protein